MWLLRKSPIMAAATLAPPERITFDPEGVLALLVADAPALGEATRARIALLIKAGE